MKAETATEPLRAPRGTQDVVPPGSAQWNAVETRMRTVAERFGYGEIRTPSFESTDVFERGVGETTDIVEKGMYTFTDRGGRRVTLRPEWTAPVVRAAMQNHLFEPGALRLYYIGPIFRYERPQRGRYRQSHQFGVECFGFAGPEADFEVISLAWELVRDYGIADATLSLNSIGDAECRPRYRAALLDHFRRYGSSLGEDSRRRLERNPLRVLDSKDPADRDAIESAPQFLSLLCEGCREHFEAVQRYLSAAGIAFAIDPRIVRGLDYYDRTVFEISSTALGAQSAVCGGGRHDGLVRSLGGPDVPAVGFAMGIERFLSVIEATGAAEQTPRRGVQAIALGARARTALVPIVAELRRVLDVPTFVDYGDRKLLSQLKIADRNRAHLALIVGDDELAAGEAIVRDLEARHDRRIALAGGRDVAAALVEADARA